MGQIKEIRNKVAFNCTTMGDVYPIDYAARVIVELFPSLKMLKIDEDASSFPKLISILEGVVGANKRHNYSKEALLSLVKEEFLKGMSVWDLLEIIGNNPFYFFPDNEDTPMFFTMVSQNLPILRKDYGDEPYVPKARPSINSTQAGDKQPVRLRRNRGERAERKGLSTDKEISSLPEIIALKKKYIELERPHEKYFWQWRVSTEDYNEYKDLLHNVDFSARTTEKVCCCARQLAFYAAEWYKREYDGNESENCFAELGINSTLNSKIWENAFRNITAYNTGETNRNLWLYSMYVLGGFPIKYTLRSNHFSSLFDQIWGEDQAQDVISDEQIDEITQGFDGNQVVKNSLISGSLHDYYRYLRKETTMPIASSDMKIDPFVNFIHNLQEGKKQYFEHYLKPTWLLYIDSHDNLIDGEIQVAFGRKEDKCYIPIEWLEYLDIREAKTLDEFEIEVSETVSGEQKSIRFSKTGPGNYPFVGWSRINKIILPISIDENSSIKVHLITKKDRYKIGTFSFGDSRQFYKTKKPYEWSSRTDNSTHTAVLFNPSIFSLCNEDKNKFFHPEEKCFQDGGRVWNWLILTEEISLKDEFGNITNYAPRNSSLEIVFKQIPHTIKYINFRDIVYHQFIDGELLKMPVTLIKDKGFSVRYRPFGSDKTDPVSLSKCSVYYKRAGDNRFIQWSGASRPEQGVLQLRVVYEEKMVTATRWVYYFPQMNPIIRITQENLIEFDREVKDIYVPISDGYTPLLRDEEGRFRYFDDIESGYLPQSDTIPFLIGKPDEEYVIIDVYRSAECKELYLKGNPKPIKRYNKGNVEVDIPLILRRNFEIRTINHSGVSRVECGENVYARFDLSNHDNYIKDEENAFRYYSVLNNRKIVNDRDPFATFVLETSPEQYRFYYWSMNVCEDPILLENLSYNPETKHLRIDISPLRNNGKGIVFQSLKGVTPRHYFRPIYCPPKGSLYGRQKFRVKCFDVAEEHCIPFVLFSSLEEMFTKPDTPYYLAQFWVELMNSRDWKPTSRDYTNLHRFAYEFLFDWIMLPKVIWSNRVREWMNTLLEERADTYKSMAKASFKEIMLRLFRTSPYVKKDDKGYLEKVIERYWAFVPNDDWDFRRSEKPENILAQCIRGRQGDHSCFDKDYDNRLAKLKIIHESPALYEGLYRLMSKKNTNN